MNTVFTFSDDTFSDLHKEVYGFRPRGTIMDNWNSMEAAQKQNRWDHLCVELEENTRFEAERAARASDRFEVRVQDVIKLGASDRATALRWMTQDEDFLHEQDVEHFVWSQGVLFTDYGRKLLKELMEIITFKEMEYE